MPELTDISFSSTDTTADIAEKLTRLLAQMRERVRFGEVRVGDTTKLDHDGDAEFADVTLTGVTMATGAAADKVLTSDADGVASWGTAAASVAGNDTEVQFNDGGALGADSGFKYNKSGKQVYAGSFNAVDSTGLKLYNASDEGIRISDDYGHVGINCDPGTGSHLDINGDTIRIRSLLVPATAGATGKVGMISIGGDYIYVCVALNTWKRASLATW